jgi:CDP-6-deoxy-D-xylo-4-hexulose-3-dehydrase
MEINSSHLLMQDNITSSDLGAINKFLKKKPKLTQGKKVEEFEKKWSKWLDIKYSVFVNSGSSANLLSIAALKILQKNKTKNEIIVPTLTWSSDIFSVMHHGFKPVFVDINFENLSMDLNEVKRKISKKTLAVFLTHAQGFCGLNQNFIKYLKEKKIFLIEDVCESHGSTLGKKKLGNFGLISNFSYYYAHHMTTIEGGMICTNNFKIYNILLSLRSHGLVREIKSKKVRKIYEKKNKKLSKDFIFLFPSYNVRNTEIGAVLGLNQLKNLDKNIKKRNINFFTFKNHLDKKKFFTNFDTKGCSNYAFPLILIKKNLRTRNKLENIMKKNKIEFRRGNAGGGNQMLQPYAKKYLKIKKTDLFPKVNHIHFYGYYIGNFPELKKKKIIEICKILNEV